MAYETLAECQAYQPADHIERAAMAAGWQFHGNCWSKLDPGEPGSPCVSTVVKTAKDGLFHDEVLAAKAGLRKALNELESLKNG